MSYEQYCPFLQSESAVCTVVYNLTGSHKRKFRASVHPSSFHVVFCILQHRIRRYVPWTRNSPRQMQLLDAIALTNVITAVARFFVLPVPDSCRFIHTLFFVSNSRSMLSYKCQNNFPRCARIITLRICQVVEKLLTIL